MCATKDVEFIEHYNAFLLASGHMADSYYHKDKLHLNSFGTRKLLKNIDAMYKVTNVRTQSKTPGTIKGLRTLGVLVSQRKADDIKVDLNIVIFAQ